MNEKFKKNLTYAFYLSIPVIVFVIFVIAMFPLLFKTNNSNG